MSTVEPGSRSGCVFSCRVPDLYYIMRIFRVPFLCGGLIVSWRGVPGACLCSTHNSRNCIVILELHILSRVYGSVTNNNVLWIGWLDLLTPHKISLNHNQLQQLTINDCLRLAPVWLDYDWLLFSCDWLGSDLRVTHSCFTNECVFMLFCSAASFPVMYNMYLINKTKYRGKKVGTR
jgi:hypothetical protein